MLLILFYNGTVKKCAAVVAVLIERAIGSGRRRSEAIVARLVVA